MNLALVAVVSAQCFNFKMAAENKSKRTISANLVATKKKHQVALNTCACMRTD